MDCSLSPTSGCFDWHFRGQHHHYYDSCTKASVASWSAGLYKGVWQAMIQIVRLWSSWDGMVRGK